jgi:PEP-CTERM motif
MLRQVSGAIKGLFLSVFLIGVLANANTINLTPTGSTIGVPGSFAVNGGSVTINSTGMATIHLNFNYSKSTFIPSTFDGIVLSPADLLFVVGSDFYGIPIATHNPQNPNGGPPVKFANVTAGDFYSSTSLLTAQTVLNNPSGVTYRKTDNVWLGATATLLGMPFTESDTHSYNGTGYTHQVTLSGQLPSLFLTDVNAHGGFSVDFGSATCANGLMIGKGGPVPLPEPSSLLMLGTGVLVVIGVLRKRLFHPSGL